MFRSRWGNHPCDYQTFHKLKLLNIVYQEAIRRARAWQRWYRKDPHNRVVRRRIRNAQGQTIGYEPSIPVPEPVLCAVFSQKTLEKRQVDKRGNFSRDGFVEERVVLEHAWIPGDYAAARKPVSEPADVRPLHCSAAEIDDLYEKARAWLEVQDLR